MRRFIGATVITVCAFSVALAEEFTGTITKVEDGSITVRKGGFGFGGKKTEAEEKTLKVAKDAKIFRSVGKDKDEVKLTLDEIKTAVKVTNIFATVTYEGETVSEIRVGGGFGKGGFGKGKGKGKGKDTKKKDI
jgi:PII-like signaling protein